jgi:hypothetical protein
MAAADGTGEERDVPAEFEAVVSGRDQDHYVLRLFLAGLRLIER